MERMELLWEKKKFLMDASKTNIVALDDFLEACSHLNIETIKYNDNNGAAEKTIDDYYEHLRSKHPTNA